MKAFVPMVLVGLLMGWTAMESVATPLPPEMLEGLQQQCVADCQRGAGNAALCARACQCTFQEVQRSLSLEDILAASQDAQSGRPTAASNAINAKVNQAANVCIRRLQGGP